MPAKRLAKSKVPEGLAEAVRDRAMTVTDVQPFLPKAKKKPMALTEAAVPTGGLSELVKGFGVELFNAAAHTQRDGIFDEVRKAQGYKGPIVTAIGDSWFLYPVELTDTIANLERQVAIRNRSWAGYTLRRHVDFADLTFKGTIELDRPTVVFMSVGGNDLLGGGALADFLVKGKPSNPASYLGKRLTVKLTEVIGLYSEVVDFIRTVRPNTRIIVHGYDHAIPQPGGRWLTRPMTAAGVPNDAPLRRAIVATIVDRWYDRLEALRKSRPQNVKVLDMRGVVGATDWFDELHPNDAGFRRVAAKFEGAL